MKPYKILLVDDRVSSLKAIKAFLEKENYEVITANSGQMAEDLFREHPDVDIVLTDLKMPGMDGLELYRRLRRLDENVILIIMTAHGTIESSVAAMREGVYDYVTKPLIMEELLVTLGKAIHDRQRDSELVALRNEVAQRYGYHNIVGQSRPMQEAFGIIKAVAPTEATVLITGETGTGKELFTKAIHYNSSRREGAHGVHRLRRPVRVPSGSRALRIYQRGFHRRGHQSHGTSGGGPPGHPLSGRSGPDEHGPAGQTAAVPSGTHF